MTQFLNELPIDGQAEAGKLEFHLVGMAIEQFGNAVVEDLPLKENNQPRLYEASPPLKETVAGEVLAIGKTTTWSCPPSFISLSPSPNLAIVTKCVEINQKEIVKESKAQVSTSVYTQTEAKTTNCQRRQPMMNILVIEDEETVRENILELLDAEEFDAIGAENGRIGLELAQQQLPDLILCDIRMPELDGYGVLRALRSEPTTATIPFIFLSAKAAKADLTVGMELGANAYITKPFTLMELLNTIEQVLLPKTSSFK